MIVSVQPVLGHEYDIEDYRHDAQHPLDDVEPASRERRLSMTDGLDHVLHHREETSREVKQNVYYRPTFGAFSLVVEVNLGHVFDKSNDGFAVSSGTKESYVFIQLHPEDLQEEDDHYEKPLEKDQEYRPHH